MNLALFSGAGGASLGIHRAIPDTPVVGIDNDWGSCRTHTAAGMPTIRADVTQYPTDPFDDRVQGLWCSPPCPDFSQAGLRKGVTGDTGRLIYEALGWALKLTPEWIVFEQVPDVLPFWIQFAHDLEKRDYSTWTGILNCADYGIPQTRQRAILIASRVHLIEPPKPTHAKTVRPTIFGPDLLPWVSMSEILGWAPDDEMIYHRGAGMIKRHGTRPGRKATEPSFTITASGSGGGAGIKFRHVLAPNSSRQPDSDGGTESVLLTQNELAILQGFPPDFPFRGNKTSVGRQIGNAVPPDFAEACVRAAAGLTKFGVGSRWPR